MGKPSRATQAKRERERKMHERAQEKQEKRALNRSDDLKLDRASMIAAGIDPDLVGIVPGPQPTQDELL